MKVLVCCEESQAVCMAFRKLGHLAFSSDIKDCSGGYPQYHMKGDCRYFVRQYNWDLIIAHPPCTFLSVVGSNHLIKDGKVYNQRRLWQISGVFMTKMIKIAQVGFCVVQFFFLKNCRKILRFTQETAYRVDAVSCVV